MPLPRNVTYAAPPIVQSVRSTRRIAGDGGVLFDLVAEVTQACTIKLGTDLMDFMGGCTLIIGPDGAVRYAIYKRLDSAERQRRMLASAKGPLRKYWTLAGGKHVPLKGTFRLLHGVETAREAGG